MDQPLMFYVAPKDKPPLPVAPVDPKQLRTVAAETEIQGRTRRGAQRRQVEGRACQRGHTAGGAQLYDTVRAEGYAAQIRPKDQQGKHVYDVRLAQISSKAEAQALADSVRGKMGVAEPKVSR